MNCDENSIRHDNMLRMIMMLIIMHHLIIFFTWMFMKVFQTKEEEDPQVPSFFFILIFQISRWNINYHEASDVFLSFSSHLFLSSFSPFFLSFISFSFLSFFSFLSHSFSSHFYLPKTTHRLFTFFSNASRFIPLLFGFSPPHFSFSLHFHPYIYLFTHLYIYLFIYVCFVFLCCCFRAYLAFYLPSLYLFIYRAAHLYIVISFHVLFTSIKPFTHASLDCFLSSLSSSSSSYIQRRFLRLGILLSISLFSYFTYSSLSPSIHFFILLLIYLFCYWSIHLSGNHSIHYLFMNSFIDLSIHPFYRSWGGVLAKRLGVSLPWNMEGWWETRRAFAAPNSILPAPPPGPIDPPIIIFIVIGEGGGRGEGEAPTAAAADDDDVDTGNGKIWWAPPPPPPPPVIIPSPPCGVIIIIIGTLPPPIPSDGGRGKGWEG